MAITLSPNSHLGQVYFTHKSRDRQKLRTDFDKIKINMGQQHINDWNNKQEDSVCMLKIILIKMENIPDIMWGLAPWHIFLAELLS